MTKRFTFKLQQDDRKERVAAGKGEADFFQRKMLLLLSQVSSHDGEVEGSLVKVAIVQVIFSL